MPAGGITLPDVVTEADLFANLDNSLLLSRLSMEPDDREPEIGMGLDWTSQLLPSTQERSQSVERPHFEDDAGLDLDLGLDIGMGHDMSIEVGRDAPAPRPVEEDLFSDDHKLQEDVGLDLDIGGDDFDMGEAPLDLGGDDGPTLGDDLNIPIEEPTALAENGDEARLQRDSESPLSSARSSVVREFDETMVQPEDEGDVSIRLPQRPKRRRVIQPDEDTILHTHQIRDQQADRSKILKPESLLPRDPVLLALMTMQKNGSFVSNVMGEGRDRQWAPELRGLLSFDSIRAAGELKRKRDSGVADVDAEDGIHLKSPRLDLGEESEIVLVDEGVGLGGDSGLQDQTEIEAVIQDDGMGMQGEDDIEIGEALGTNEEEDIGAGFDTFDETTMPILHPADSGPVSLGTKHAVHLLRDQFGGESSSSQEAQTDSPSRSQPQHKSVLFQDLLPEAQTTKADATKMFFEVLVLATKDAVKVEQKNDVIGGPLRIRAKRGLWGEWAEVDAGGEIANQEEGAEAVTAAA